MGFGRSIALGVAWQQVVAEQLTTLSAEELITTEWVLGQERANRSAASLIAPMSHPPLGPLK